MYGQLWPRPNLHQGLRYKAQTVLPFPLSDATLDENMVANKPLPVGIMASINYVVGSLVSPSHDEDKIL